MNDEQYAEVLKELAANNKEHESYNRRLKEHDEKLEKQNEILVLLERLTNTVKVLTDNMSEVKSTLHGVDNRLGVIEKEPAEKWKKAGWELFKYVLLAVVAGAVGYITRGAG